MKNKQTKRSINNDRFCSERKEGRKDSLSEAASDGELQKRAAKAKRMSVAEAVKERRGERDTVAGLVKERGARGGDSVQTWPLYKWCIEPLHV